jgi:Uncharacterised nucleotidyltransferase
VIERWPQLLRALRDPMAMAAFDAATWDLVVRQASSAGLLGRLGALSRRAGIAEQLPLPVQRKLTAVLTIAAQQQRAVHWELVQLAQALDELEGPVLLLKGAAYAAAGLPPAPGRLFSDIDILVPKAQLGAAEAALMLVGWVSGHRSAYDQRYYREWMHEVPPMTHIRRQTVIDLHHNILPETARLRTQAEPMIARANPLPAFPRFSVPSPVDLVLHSATHLFHEGEWEHGLRDLVDLDAMLRVFGEAQGFWDELRAVAGEMGQGRPVYYGLRYCHQLLDTPLPDGLIERWPSRPPGTAASLMDRLFVPGFSTAHHSCRLPGAGPASFALFVRSHWLRMPMHLLLPHLVRKAWMESVVSRFGRGKPGAGHPARHVP